MFHRFTSGGIIDSPPDFFKFTDINKTMKVRKMFTGANGSVFRLVCHQFEIFNIIFILYIIFNIFN